MLINPYAFGRLWTPADIATALWLDASDASTLTTANGLVSEWRDKSGNGRHAGQGNSSFQPSHSNGSVVFNQTNLGLSALAWPTSGYSLIGVVQASSVGTAGVGLINIQSTPNDDPEIRLLDYTSSYIYYNAGYAITAAFSIFSNKSILGLEMSAGVTAELFANGTSQISGTRSGALSTTSTFQLGYYGLINGRRNGTIWHLIVYPTSTDNRQRLEGWLAHKENLTANLPAGHPYKSAAPTV